MKDIRDFLTYRIEEELRINEADVEIQNAYKRFFNKKLNEYGVTTAIELHPSMKNEFYNDVISNWTNSVYNEELNEEDNSEITMPEFLAEAFTVVSQNMVNEPLLVEDVMTYISELMESYNIDEEIDLEILINENFNQVFTFSTDENNIDYLQLTDDALQLTENEEFADIVYNTLYEALTTEDDYVSENDYVSEDEIIDMIGNDIVDILEMNLSDDMIDEFLSEIYGINIDVDELNKDIELLNEEDAKQEPTTGQKIKGHLKKHWKKYAGAAVGAAALGGGAYLAHKKGWIGKKKIAEVLPKNVEEYKAKQFGTESSGLKNMTPDQKKERMAAATAKKVELDKRKTQQELTTTMKKAPADTMWGRIKQKLGSKKA